ncbi:hypothetical protein COUCH_16975 [Couchioplanes caeruleus]|uniref:WXG100 family type VII secretion target n=1 Tax=Couchioplanes caeruleus TaxID=56438 RepID=UPI0020C09E21|nr:hypothetical protein [Couchioplanes caeruleus]UQU67862.1 hypothetical protein COUCH_16975 [Couchioplanes caeruleus]
MAITLHALVDADTGALRGVADRWLALVDAIDTTVGDLGAETRDLPYHWSGDDAPAAQERVAKLRTQIGNAHVKCACIADALRGFADDIAHCQRMLRGVVDEARAAGLTVDLQSGTVTAPLATVAAESRAGVDAYAAQISEILRLADDADRRTRAELDRQSSSVGEWLSLPSELHWSEQVDPVSQSVFATKVPVSQAAVWHYAHPLEKERLITEQPEVYGAAEGLPSEDRDTANRILLAREKASLIDQQALLANGTASPPDPSDGPDPQRQELAAVNSRLAAVERLENRMNDPRKPKMYLVDYRPGDEENTVLSAGGGQYDDAWVGTRQHRYGD